MQVRYWHRPPAELEVIATALRKGDAGAWERFVGLTLRDQRIVVVRLLDMGALLGQGGVADRCNAEAMRRTRAGEDDGADYGLPWEPTPAFRAAVGVAARRTWKSRAARRKRARIAMLSGLP